MEILIGCMVFVSITLLLYATVAGRGQFSGVQARLAILSITDGALSAREDDLSKPFHERIFFPALSGMGSFLSKYALKGLRNRMAVRLIQAGYVRTDPAIYLGIRAAVAIGLAVFAAFAGVLGHLEIRKLALCFFAFPIMGFILPNLWLSMLAKKRKAAISAVLPDLLDFLAVSVEAGLGFDQALARASEKLKGPLGDEVKRTFHEISMGNPRANSLRSMSERVGLPDLSSFTAALVQADQLGVSIASILRLQSDSMRIKHRQRTEEAALKAPVKLLFPLIVFIFPILFIILLGPAVINIIDNLM